MRKFILRMRPQAQMTRIDAVFHVPLESRINPVFEPFKLFVRIRPHEELHLHLLELAGAKNEVTGSDFVAERFAGLRDPERQLDTLSIDHVREIAENPLRGLGPEIDCTRSVLNWTDKGFEHQIELTCF